MTWLQGGYNDWFSISVSESKFQLRFNRRASLLYQNFDDAATDAAQLLYKEWGDRPLYLALSGGIDSEFVARILVENNIPFTPIILKIESINDQESWYAEYWCHCNSIKPIILNYTIDDYANQTVVLFRKLQQIKNFNMTSTLLIYEHAHQLGGHAIFCGGDINLDPDTKKFYCRSLDFPSNLVDVGRHPTSFFMYTPELALSYINQFDITQSEQYNKLSFYRVAPRPKIDYIPLIPQGQIQKNKSKLFYIFKIKKQDFDACYWYGTKEQIVQNLQP